LPTAAWRSNSRLELDTGSQFSHCCESGVRVWLGIGRYEHGYYAVVISEYAPLAEASGSARLVP